MVWDVKGRGFSRDPYWDDMRFPAAGINPPGQVSDPDIDVTIGGLLFDAASTELVSVIAQLPHSYFSGSKLYPHCHWQKTTSAAGNVLWQLDYRWAAIGEVMDADWTTLTTTTLAGGTPDNDTANEHLISSFTGISGEGKEMSDMLVMQFSRIGGDAADTYGADARLLEFDIHFASDCLGSDDVFTKTVRHS